MTVSAGTILSSLASHRLTGRLGTARVTLLSVALTAAALLGYAHAKNTAVLFLLAVPLGLGAGSVDAALNNFVALYYKSKHMNWLHCFWGVGATVGPMIMSLVLLGSGGWRRGYSVIATIQWILVFILFVTLPLWRQKEVAAKESNDQTRATMSNTEALKLPQVKLALVSFVFFCVTEATTGLWSSSYLVGVKGVAAPTAAQWTAYFYGGITIGRLLAGFASINVSNIFLIRLGQLGSIAGAIILMLPLPTYFSLVGIVLIGLGTAPIFPAMLHETPNRFGSAASGAIMGLQMAFAYVGALFGPALFGTFASIASLKMWPYYLFLAATTMFIASELLQRRLRGSTPQGAEGF